MPKRAGDGRRSSGSPEPVRPGSDRPRADVAPRRTWDQLAQNRFWLIVPILAFDLALVGMLPPPLAPGSPGPDIPGWLSVSETVLRVVVMGARCLMPLSLRTPTMWPALAVYSVGLATYVAAWVAVVWAPTSAWSTNPVGFTALAWTSIILFTGIGMQSTLRFFPGYRPWMYLAALFTAVHTGRLADVAPEGLVHCVLVRSRTATVGSAAVLVVDEELVEVREPAHPSHPEEARGRSRSDGRNEPGEVLQRERSSSSSFREAAPATGQGEPGAGERVVLAEDEMCGEIAGRPRIQKSRRLGTERVEQVAQLCSFDGVEEQIVHVAGA
jgi:hypothetical protein